MPGPRRASQPERDGPVETEPDRSRAKRERPVRPRGTAKDRALRLLGVRDRSRRELELRLLRAGFERDVVDQALDELTAAGLIDDERYAAQVVEHAMTGRPAGRRAVMTGLLSKGVDRSLAERALEPLGATEEARAEALASRQAVRLRSLDPAVAFRRLSSLLIRRGFAPGLAFSTARRALGAPEPEDP
jgi:regulatory protein